MTEINAVENINVHIEQAISDYLNMTPAPRYAFCVTGEWGSGKTYLLKQKIKELQESSRPVAYVSLNGISSTKQIDEELLNQFYPVLRNAKLKIASRLGSGILKAAFKIDLEKIFDVESDKYDASVEASLPNSKLEVFLSKTNDSILFFDDIERSKISIEEVLGYINYFVEHTGQKVFIGCSESQIVDKPAYIEKKEKIIGISLPVKTNAKEALHSFLHELSPVCKKLLETNFLTILKIFEEAGYNNLRVLRQSCLRFNAVIENLTSKHTENVAFIADLVGNYFPLALEIYGGKLGDENIKKLYEIDAIVSRLEESRKDSSSYEEKKNKRKNFNDFILNKYSTLSHSSVGWDLYSVSPIWVDFFVYGVIDQTHLDTAILAHQAFYDVNTPSWRRLWYWRSGKVSQVDFEKYLLDVLQKIDNKEYKTIIEVIHVWCIVLGIHEKNCWPLSIDKKYLITDAVDYITERMQDSSFLSEDLIRRSFDENDFLDSGLGGLGVHGASHGKPRAQYFLAISQAFHDGQIKLQCEYKNSLKEEFLIVLKTDNYQLNNYLEKLQSSPYMPLFEELDFDILIKEFDTEDALIYANLDYFIYRALKSNVIEKNNPVIQTNFINLKTAISTKLCKAKSGHQIITVSMEGLINQIDNILNIPLAEVESVKSI